MESRLNFEYDLRPELTAYCRLLSQLFDAQADLRRTEFARQALTRRARATLWLSRALDDLAFNFDDLTAGEHLSTLALGQSAVTGVLTQTQTSADPEAISLVVLTQDLLAEAGRVMGIMASRLGELGLLDSFSLNEPEGSDN